LIALFKLILPILIFLITSGILIPDVGASIQNDNEVYSSNPQTTTNQVDEGSVNLAVIFAFLNYQFVSLPFSNQIRI
jgi:hypothetical protein